MILTFLYKLAPASFSIPQKNPHIRDMAAALGIGLRTTNMSSYLLLLEDGRKAHHASG
jgi:hypothetical protein